MCWLTKKTMTKKMTATPHSSPPLGLQAVPVGWLYFFTGTDDIYLLQLVKVPHHSAGIFLL